MEDAKAPYHLRAEDVGDGDSTNFAANKMAYELAKIAAVVADAGLDWEATPDASFKAQLLCGVVVESWRDEEAPESHRFGFRVLADGRSSGASGPEASIFGDAWHAADRAIEAEICAEMPENIKLLQRVWDQLRETRPQQAKRVEEKLAK